MRRRKFIAGLGGAALALQPLVAHAQQFVGAWRATNQCFLAAFILMEGGRAQAAYLSGERDDNAVWTWDGSTLRITSATFPLDRFTGHLANDRVEADYVWHDLERDQLHGQTCVFERFDKPNGDPATALDSSPSRQAHQHPARDHEHGPQ
jgi:hypothetical protein